MDNYNLVRIFICLCICGCTSEQDTDYVLRQQGTVEFKWETTPPAFSPAGQLQTDNQCRPISKDYVRILCVNKSVAEGYFSWIDTAIHFTIEKVGEIGLIPLAGYMPDWLSAGKEFIGWWSFGPDSIIVLNTKEMLVFSKGGAPLKTIRFHESVPENYYAIATDWLDNRLAIIDDEIFLLIGGEWSYPEKAYPLDMRFIMSVNIKSGRCRILPFKIPDYGNELAKSQCVLSSVGKKVLVRFIYTADLFECDFQSGLLKRIDLFESESKLEPLRELDTTNLFERTLGRYAHQIKPGEFYFIKELNCYIYPGFMPLRLERRLDNKSLDTKYHLVLNIYDEELHHLHCIEYGDEEIHPNIFVVDDRIYLSIKSATKGISKYTVFKLDLAKS